MSDYVLIIGNMDLSYEIVDSAFKEVWNYIPIIVTQGIDGVTDYFKDCKSDVIFIRIDDVRNNGLDITRLIKKFFLESGLYGWLTAGAMPCLLLKKA